MLKIKSLFVAAALASTLGASAAFADPMPGNRADDTGRDRNGYTDRDRNGYNDRDRPIPHEVVGIRGRAWSWTSLGEVRTGNGRFRAAILDLGRGVGQLARLRLDVRAGDLGQKRVFVTFGDGSTFAANVAGRTAIIDLPGQARNVRSIEVEPLRNGRRVAAVVDIQGERAPRPVFR